MTPIVVRRGYTLIEMLAFITASVTLMGVSMALIHSAFNAERSLRGQLARRQAFDRLAESFRRDAHTAEQVSIVTDPPQCVLGGEGQPSIVYRLKQGQVVRDVRQGEKLIASVAFPLPRHGTVEFHQQEETGHSLVSFTLMSEPVEGVMLEPKTCRICVKALLGRDAMAASLLVPQSTSSEPLGEKP